MKMIVEKGARLNGKDVKPGQEIDLPQPLVKAWQAAGLARAAIEPPKKPERKRPKRKRPKRTKPHEQTVKEPGERAVERSEPE